mmetsp:Transcript_15585/g.27556  ORF Transcript_15585/g.27556 Transcript_15585/m.27556 type:complete len:150 (-) Transcript_15585:19-468(-)
MRIRAQIDSNTMAWLGALPSTEHSFDFSAEQWLYHRLVLQVGWQLKGWLPAKCDGCGDQPFATDHALCCLYGDSVKCGHDQLRDTMVDVCRMAWGNCTLESVVRPAPQWAKDGEKDDGITVDFATRDVWGDNILAGIIFSIYHPHCTCW